MLALRRLLDGPAVIEIEDQFAIDFDELGITVELRSDATDQELLALKEKAVAYMLPRTSPREEPFKWMWSFKGHKYPVSR
jgi:hypothetical protein